MEPNQQTQQGEQRVAIPVSEKRLNEADWLIWPTGGRFSAPSGHRCNFLVVGQTRAEIAPCQQTRKTGQVIPYG